MRFNYLLRQYQNLSAVSPIFSALAGRPAGEWMDAAWVEQQLVEQRAAIERGELEAAQRGLGAVEAMLQGAREALLHFDHGLSAYALRVHYQQRGARVEEVAALLQFLLAKSPLEAGDLDKLDYLATRFYALSAGAGGEFAGPFENLVRGEYEKMLDLASIVLAGAPDPEVMERFKFFREEFGSLATFEQLSTNDTLGRLREFKAGLEGRWFYPEVLIEVARVNLLAGQCFQELANRERQHIDRLATELISAGISEVDHPEGEGRLPIEDAREISELSASLLDQDYRRNKDRLARIAQLKNSLARAHEHITANDEPVASQGRGAPPPAAEVEAAEAILIELSPTPERLQQDLRARVAHLSKSLSHPAPAEAEATLTLEGSALPLAPWERAAFQNPQAQTPLGETRLRRLLRVSVALMAELQEKAELVCRGVAVGQLRNTYLIGARYLVQLSQQTARELELRCVNPDEPLPREVREQLHHTRRRLLATCSEFSAKVREAAGQEAPDASRSSSARLG
jgi:hypothetical protein